MELVNCVKISLMGLLRDDWFMIGFRVLDGF